MRRLRYNVACSLDGFIAGPHGDYDWIVSDPSIDFNALFAQFDTFILGRTTYEAVTSQGDQNPLLGRQVIVASRSLRQAEHPGVQVIGEHLTEAVSELKSRPGRDIWLFGGGNLARTLMDARLVDTVEVALMPVLLTRGVRIVPEGAALKLSLESAESLVSGIQMLRYSIDYGA